MPPWQRKNSIGKKPAAQKKATPELKKVKQPEKIRELPKPVVQSQNIQMASAKKAPELPPELPELSEEVDKKKPVRYMVIGTEDVHHFIDLLETGAIPADEVNYMRLRKPPFKGKVSFGVFRLQVSAESRKEVLKSYGIDSVIVNRLNSTDASLAKAD